VSVCSVKELANKVECVELPISHGEQLTKEESFSDIRGHVRDNRKSITTRVYGTKSLDGNREKFVIGSAQHILLPCVLQQRQLRYTTVD
jgi:hypothetical protein